MLDEERIYRAAVSELCDLAIKDMALATESFMAREAGDLSKVDAAENARAALVPAMLKAEENVLRAEIAGATAAKDSIARLIRSDASPLPLQTIEEIVARFTGT